LHRRNSRVSISRSAKIRKWMARRPAVAEMVTAASRVVLVDFPAALAVKVASPVVLVVLAVFRAVTLVAVAMPN